VALAICEHIARAVAWHGAEADGERRSAEAGVELEKSVADLEELKRQLSEPVWPNVVTLRHSNTNCHSHCPPSDQTLSLSASYETFAPELQRLTKDLAPILFPRPAPYWERFPEAESWRSIGAGEWRLVFEWSECDILWPQARRGCERQIRTPQWTTRRVMPRHCHVTAASLTQGRHGARH